MNSWKILKNNQGEGYSMYFLDRILVKGVPVQINTITDLQTFENLNKIHVDPI